MENKTYNSKITIQYSIAPCLVLLLSSNVALATGGATWNGKVEAYQFKRSNVSNQSLAGLANGTFGDPSDDTSVLETNDLEFGSKPAVRVTFNRDIGEDRQIDASVLWMDSFSQTKVVESASGQLDVPFKGNVTNDFDGANRVEVKYNSKMHGIESNFRRKIEAYKMTATLGARYIRLSEQLNINSNDNGDASDYDVDTDNQMLGVQAGLEKAFPLSNNKTSITLGGKVGLLMNRSKQRQTIRDNNNTDVLRDKVDSKTKASWLGEVNVDVSHKLTKHVKLHAGYRMLALNNVALAPDQLDFNTPLANTGGGVTHDDVLYHAAYIGIGASW